MEARPLIEPVVEAAGYDLVDVALTREAGRRVLRITVDAPGGADIDAMARLSDQVSRRLDLEDFDGGTYDLQVSSPGLERSLVRAADFRRCLGAQVRVETTAPIDGRMAHTGELTEAGDDAIEIATQTTRVRIPLADVAKAKTVVDWDAELKGSNR